MKKLMEEDDKIKQLFDSFDPVPETSDRDFMDRLARSLDSVEMITQRAARLRRRNRRAVIAAAAVGFVTGVGFTLAMPFIKGFVSNLMSSVPPAPESVDPAAIIGWVIAAGATALVALATYELAGAVTTSRNS